VASFSTSCLRFQAFSSRNLFFIMTFPMVGNSSKVASFSFSFFVLYFLLALGSTTTIVFYMGSSKAICLRKNCSFCALEFSQRL